MTKLTKKQELTKDAWFATRLTPEYYIYIRRALVDGLALEANVAFRDMSDEGADGVLEALAEWHSMEYDH